ncbi:hypothetical protein [Embleya sp. NBC_00896]|nr:hypothetical protein OG928_29080 [Embleya sp. NBC_00896]
MAVRDIAYGEFHELVRRRDFRGCDRAAGRARHAAAKHDRPAAG